MNYKIINLDDYYRKSIFRHFSNDCKCSASITSRVDVSALYDHSKCTNTKFYINFLYLLSKTLNSRDDYRMVYFYKTNELAVYDKVNPAHYIFHEDTETFTIVYSEYFENYDMFYSECAADIERAKNTREYGIDDKHPNWFDASFVSWLSYDSLNIELPDGHLHFPPIINWGKFREENGKYMMPLSVRMNHAAADGFLISNVFVTLENEIKKFCNEEK